MPKKRKVTKAKARGKRSSGRRANARIGSSFEAFLDEDGIRDEVTVLALKRVIAWQVANEMEKKDLTKSEMADLMNTSRSALDRLLDESVASLSIKTLDKAARALGKRVVFELVDA